MTVRERREFQRLSLPAPLSAEFGAASVQVLEIGVTGARLEADHPLTVGVRHPLRFVWEGEQLELEAEVVRSVTPSTPPASPRRQSGVAFAAAQPEMADRLRGLLARIVLHRLSERRLEAPALELVDADDTLRPGDARFVTWTREEGVWRKRRSFLPDQPDDGFTVAASEDREELQRLCRTWEQADAEGRRLLRLFCELSVSDAMNVPGGG